MRKAELLMGLCAIRSWQRATPWMPPKVSQDGHADKWLLPMAGVICPRPCLGNRRKICHLSGFVLWEKLTERGRSLMKQADISGQQLPPATSAHRFREGPSLHGGVISAPSLTSWPWIIQFCTPFIRGRNDISIMSPATLCARTSDWTTPCATGKGWLE